MRDNPAPMRIGVDLGGTKIEAQVFDASWGRVTQRRIDTPRDYPRLVAAMAAGILSIAPSVDALCSGVRKATRRPRSGT